MTELGKLLGLFLLASWTSVSWGIEPYDGEPLNIVNGTEESGFKATVSLGATFGGYTMSMCSGSLIAPRVVLSAAHCGSDLPIELITAAGSVVFGKKVDNPTSTIGIADQIGHPEYQALVSGYGGSLGQYDLSVVILEEDAPEDPIWIRETPFPENVIGHDITSVGYGVTGADQMGGGTKRSAELSIYDVDDMFIISKSASNTNGANVCSGDSGGPQYYLENPTGEICIATAKGECMATRQVEPRWVQWAVHSWADENCMYESGSTRVDLSADWILDQVESVHGSRDVCAVNQYYNDGVCDYFCGEPDPDCVSTALGCSHGKGLPKTWPMGFAILLCLGLRSRSFTSHRS